MGISKEQRGIVLAIEPDVFVPENMVQVSVRMEPDGSVRTFLTTRHHLEEKQVEVGKALAWRVWWPLFFFLNHMSDVTQDEDR